MAKEPENTIFKRLCNALYANISEDELNRLFSWEYCELDREFPCFADVYADIPFRIPRYFRIIDFGCNQALQAAFFSDYTRYIGVDSGVPIEWRLRQSNVWYTDWTIQEYINYLKRYNTKTDDFFAICSYVPDNKARQMVRETFKYYRDYYGADDWYENFPKMEETT